MIRLAIGYVPLLHVRKYMRRVVAMRLPTRNSMRLFSKGPLDSFMNGSKVRIQSTNEIGLISSVGQKGGWLSININNQIKKVRAKDLQLLNDESSVELASILPSQDNQSIDKINSIDYNIDSTPEYSTPYEIKYIDAPSQHARVKNWIIFSDLHVKSSSIDICEEVLQTVHKAAVERDAGVIFLGDFWHVRGALNVDLLNRILSQFSLWTQPVIMIPGNHDQVSLGGTIHALEPLQYAFKDNLMLLISEPVVCLGALWIPYRRDHNLLKSILNAGAICPDVRIVYCHADVKGASMNDGMKSREGMDIHLFPQHIPIYSGHYHKPHTISKGSSSLHYVGSPYQTSLSEANEIKYLYNVRCDKSPTTGVYSWTETEKWSIDIGPKFFKVRSPDADAFHKAKSGDKVVLTVKEGTNVIDLLASMKSKNIEVELREEKNIIRSLTSNESDIDAEEESTAEPRAAFLDFMRLNNSLALTEDEGVDETFRANIVREGLETIEKLLNSATASLNKSIDGSNFYNLDLHSVHLSGFGPFAGKVDYPLSNRGLVLIRGKSRDNTGADSNGAGKTTLAMSVLWALTGSLDARLFNDGKAVDVAYDCIVLNEETSSKAKTVTAEVSLLGSINGKFFKLVRRRSSKKSELIFFLDSIDMTKQSTRDTQAIIDITLGVGQGLLQRCCFFGQHSHTQQALLGLTDIRLKNELSLLVDTSIWTAAVADLKSREKSARARISDIAVEIKIRNEELIKETRNLDDSKSSLSIVLEEITSLNNTIKELVKINSTSTIGFETVESSKNRLLLLEKQCTNERVSIEMLRKDNEVRARKDMQLLYGIDKQISELEQSKSESQFALQSSTNAFKSLKLKLNHLDSQLKSIRARIGNLLNRFSNSRLILSSLDDLKKLLVDRSSKLQSYTQKLAEFEVLINNTNSALQKVEAIFCSNHGDQSTTERAACPTCGQDLQNDSAIIRKQTLISNLSVYSQGKSNVTKMYNSARVAVDALQESIKLTEQMNVVDEQIKETENEAKSFEKAIQNHQQASSHLENDINLKLHERAEFLKNSNNFDVLRSSEMSNAEGRLKALSGECEDLKNAIIPLQRSQSETMEKMAKFQQQLAVLNERNMSISNIIASKIKSIDDVRLVVEKLEDERNRLVNNVTIMSRTADVIGPRGVQQYIFMTVIKVLEKVANAYLVTLADGGIQLNLQGDDNGDRIIKTVLIRGSDSVFRERGLSQLSGGQWRRVSLALDLAFAEIVRKRGLLRCNIVVMDEILTHLDACGREAVGTVLRGLVKSSYSPSRSTTRIASEEADTGDENENQRNFDMYETVIVILQDLAAQELEEAFDHIDNVVKESDSSYVLVDGN